MDKPVWVPQWLLTEERLGHWEELVQEQLKKGHIRPTMSPWNTPVFVIQKKSGKWRFLRDLRAGNACMKPMGVLQPGLPSPAAIPHHWSLFIVDVKDCFFSIPLHEDDRERFAFSVPSLNNANPAAWYEWTVLPQGMRNSPSICQWYVAQALGPWRKEHKDTVVYHYMDDILVASKQPLSEEVKDSLLIQLRKWGLDVAPEKVQTQAPWNYLGLVITEERIRPNKLSIHADIRTVNDVQKLVGDIQWIRTWCGISNEEMRPLFALLEGSQHPTEPRALSEEGKAALSQIKGKLGCTQAY